MPHWVSGQPFYALVDHGDGPRGRSCLRGTAEVIRQLRLVGLLVSLAVGILSCDAQRTPNITRIGILTAGTSSPLGAALLEELRARGYVEGRNLVVERRDTDGSPERLAGLAADLVRLNARVIVAAGYAAARAAQIATATIPIVAITADLVEDELVASLARPGGNITGLSTSSRQLSWKRLELLRAVAPEVSRVTVVWNPHSPAKALDWRATQFAADALGFKLEAVEVGNSDELERGFSGIAREPRSALLISADTFTVSRAPVVVSHVAKTQLPAIYESSDFVVVGGLMAYGPRVLDAFRRGATYVDSILKGANPADLPVGELTRFELVINLKTAKALDLTIPQLLLLRADQVIE